jgi:hypothetical protein
MLFTGLLHVSRVTAMETKAKQQAKLFPKHDLISTEFDI